MSDQGGSPASRLHRGVEDAVHMVWNNRYDEAEMILESKRTSNPRYALEYANLFLIKGLMNASNEKREALLGLFKEADGLASKTKYGQPMVPDSSDEEDEDIARSAETDVSGAELTEKDRKKIEKLKQDEAKKQREKEKEAFKRAQKEASKTGQPVDVSWKLECDVIYADALLVRSLVQLAMNSYLKGGINLRSTWGYYYALMQDVEKDTAGLIPRELVMNIKYGCGTFYTYLALVPAGLMKLLSAIGFISDKELGEQYLTEVFKSETIRSPFAALVLCTYYLFLPTGLGNVEETLAKAKIVLETMNARYPDNTYFHGYTNFFHRKRGETKEAVEAIVLAATNAEKAGCVPLLLRYLHADTLFMDLQFGAARTKYMELLKTLEDAKETFAYTGQVVLSLAACNVMLGDDATGITWLKKVGSMYNSKSKQDSNSPKYAARVLSELKLLPLIGVYILYINRDLAHMKAAHAERLMGELRRVTAGKDLASPECSGMLNLFTGVITKGCGRKDEAMVEWDKNVALEKKLSSDSMVLPYTFYEMGELEYRRGNLPRAKQLFEKGQSFKGEGHETLSNRYSIALKQLKRVMAEKGIQ